MDKGGPRSALMTRFEEAFQDSPARVPQRKCVVSATNQQRGDCPSRQSISQIQGEIAQGLDKVRRCIADINVLRHSSDIELEKSLASMKQNCSPAPSLGLVLQVL